MESGRESEQKIYKKLAEALVKDLDMAISNYEDAIKKLKQERKELLEAFGNEEIK